MIANRMLLKGHLRASLMDDLDKYQESMMSKGVLLERIISAFQSYETWIGEWTHICPKAFGREVFIIGKDHCSHCGFLFQEMKK